MNDELTQTIVVFHSKRLADAFKAYIAKYDLDPEGVEINQLDHESGTQWWARSKGADGIYDNPVLLYEVGFDNPMEVN